MKRCNRWWTATLVVLAVALVAGVAETRERDSYPRCSPVGTWTGFNAVGEVLTNTMIQTRPGEYHSVIQTPPWDLDPDVFPGVLAATEGFHGVAVRTGPRTFEFTFVGIWRVDPEVWFGYDLVAVVPRGTMEMPNCDRVENTYEVDSILFHTGEDPFQDGYSIGTTPMTSWANRVPLISPE